MNSEPRRDIPMKYVVSKNATTTIVSFPPSIHNICQLRVDKFLAEESLVQQVLQMGMQQFKGYLRYFVRNIRKMDFVFLAVDRDGFVLASTFIIAQYQEWIVAEAMTHPEWRRCHINEALQAAIIAAAHASASGRDPVYLLTLTCNPEGAAYHLYKKLGYTE